jgi:hypothetical protein
MILDFWRLVLLGFHELADEKLFNIIQLLPVCLFWFSSVFHLLFSPLPLSRFGCKEMGPFN